MSGNHVIHQIDVQVETGVDVSMSIRLDRAGEMSDNHGTYPVDVATTSIVHMLMPIKLGTGNSPLARGRGLAFPKSRYAIQHVNNSGK